MDKIIFLAIAGMIGTLSRYGLSGAAHRVLGDGFPYGTLAVNFLGSMLIGFLMHVALNTDAIPGSMRLATTVGFLGAFTTFSTFSYETVSYLESGAWSMAATNVLANVGLGIIGAVSGIVIGRITVAGA